MASSKSNREAVFSKPSTVGDERALLHFGAFTLDLKRHGLYLAGKRLHLTSKPFETLVVLVEHRGKAIEKQKLLDAVWKEAFVTEDSLVKAVREIRRVLDDEKANPRFVQTVPGEGYRFIAEVTAGNPDAENPQSPGQQSGEIETTDSSKTDDIPGRATEPHLRFWSRRHLAGMVVVLLVLVAAGILWQSWHKSASPTLRPAPTRILSTFHAASTSVSLSPDGNWITFIADLDGVPQVWIKNLAGGEPMPITSGGTPASDARWSPRNDEIVFSRGKGTQSIWSVPPLGGQAPRLLLEEGRNPRWSTSGDRLVFEKRDEIWTSDSNGSHPRRVDGIPRVELLVVDREPSLSPDGSKIAFFQPEDGPMGDIWVIPSGGGQATRLTFDNHYGGSPVWTPDGNYVVFASQRGGSKTLWKVHRNGGAPEAILNSSGEDTNPEISSDGTRLIYARTRNFWVLTVKDLGSGKTRELREAVTDMYFPRISPRGDKIAFFATVDEGDIHIFTIGTDGKELAQVTRGKAERNVFPTWSADGSTLYFYQLRPDRAFRGIAAAGGTSFPIANGWRWRTHNAAEVDPTGKRIAYSRIEKGNVVATLIRDIRTGSETAFARALADPRWSKDGESILGADMRSSPPDSQFGDIVVCSVEGRLCQTVATHGAGPIWSENDSLIYFERPKSTDSQELWAVSRQGQNARWMADLQQVDPSASFYDVSTAGVVAYVQFKPGKQELWITDFK
jgi:Tol biopolymer transport system component/DNA-binding winged helix-turn-helix (wHTH) protein